MYMIEKGDYAEVVSAVIDICDWNAVFLSVIVFSADKADGLVYPWSVF